MNDEQFKQFIKDNIAANPAEAKIVRKVYKALKDAGNPVVAVDDTEERTPVSTLQETLELVFNLDVAYLITKSGGWVMIVLGNEWDALSDYTLGDGIEEALEPVNEWIANKW